MSASTDTDAVQEYLARLRSAMRRLPRRERAQILEETRAHIAEAVQATFLEQHDLPAVTVCPASVVRGRCPAATCGRLC